MFLKKIKKKYIIINSNHKQIMSQAVAKTKEFPFIDALKKTATYDGFFPALDKWLDGDTDALTEMYNKKQIPIIKRSSAFLYRCVMVSPKEYEAFIKGGHLKAKGVLQSWSASEVMGTPYKNIKKPIYLHFAREVQGSDIVLHMSNDLWAYKKEREIMFDKHNLIEQESEVICKSMALSKSEMDWNPFIPDYFEDEDYMMQICEKFDLDFGDAHSM